MKEAYLLCAYTPDDERIEILNETINFLKNTGRDIFLVSHSSNTPNHIISKCKYFLYSSENILMDDPDHKYFVYHQVGEFEVGSKYFNSYKCTTVAIYDMFLNGLALLKNCGYNICHYVEYDANFENAKIFDLFSEKIKEGYECCVITGDTQGIHGGLLTIGIDYFANEELKNDLNKVIEWSKKLQITEHVTEKLFFESKKMFKYDINFAKMIGYNMTDFNHHKKGIKLDTVIFHGDQTFYFCNNTTDDIYRQSIIINNEHLINVSVPPKTYLFKDIFPKNQVKIVLFVKENKVVESFDFSTEEKIFNFQQNSYLKKIK